MVIKTYFSLPCKMIDLYRDPNGTKIFNDPHFELNGTTPSLRNDQNTGEVHP